MPASARHDVALLLLRIAGGGFLLPHGLGKLFGWFGGPGLAGFAEELTMFGIPNAAPLPLLIASLQTVLGLLVLLGFFTRPAALLASLFIGVTGLVNLHGGWFWNQHGIEYPLFWALTLVAIALLGPGALSLDATRRRA